MENLTAESCDSNEAEMYIKIKSVLFQLLSPRFKISDDSILQKLYDTLSPIIPKEDCHQLLINVFVPWIHTVIKEWKSIDQASCAFALRMLSSITSIEQHFSMLIESSIMGDISELLRNSDGNKSSVISSYLELIQSIISHEAGCLWIWENGIWKEVLNISRNNTSLYILRQTHEILADVIIIFGNKDLSKCHVILDDIFQDCSHIIQEDTSLHSLVLKNMHFHHEHFSGGLNNINSVVILRETILRMLSKKIGYIEIKDTFRKYNLQAWAMNVLNNSNNVKVIVEVSKLLSVVNIGFLPRLENGDINYSDMRFLAQQFLDQCNVLGTKHQYILTQEVCVEYLKMWNQYAGKIVYDVKETESEIPYTFENTLFIILTLPLLISIGVGKSTKSEMKEAFVEKIFGISCLQTKRVAYSLKKEIHRKKVDVSIETLACSSIQCLIRISKICKKEQAVMIFQTLVHLVKSIIPTDGHDYCTEKATYQLAGGEGVLHCQQLVSSTVEALNCYISNFNLTWSDSLETVCVMPLMQILLTIPDISPKLAADIIKLQKIILLEYLPANVALLMDTVEGTSMSYIGQQIFKNLHSPYWEIRDSALELLQVICTLSEHKMPVFQKVVLEAKLPCLVVSAFENDSEPYVKSSALNCLSSMVRIPELWEQCSANQTLQEKIIEVLLNEPEGIVRYRSILLLKEIYNSRELRPEEIEKFMNVLYHVTITDLHWEVKNGAILFWDCVLEKKLSEKGMVDGNFPDHLFSREKRKIIKLTPKEISERVRKVLDVLCDYGCLHALWYTVKDDCDLSVTGEANRLIMKIIDLVKKFNVPINKSDIREEVDSERIGLKRKISSEDMDVENEIMKHTAQSSDDVIESIVSEGDINLVCGLLRNMDSKGVPLQLRQRKKLSLDNFYCYVTGFDVCKKQIDKIVWMYLISDSTNSVLDDILVANQVCDSKNDIDCY